MRDSSSGDKLNFGDLSLEKAMDLSRYTQILELEFDISSSTFRRNVVPPSSGSKRKKSKWTARSNTL
jgi:hypothetical protein